MRIRSGWPHQGPWSAPRQATTVAIRSDVLASKSRPPAGPLAPRAVFDGSVPGLPGSRKGGSPIAASAGEDLNRRQRLCAPLTVLAAPSLARAGEVRAPRFVAGADVTVLGPHRSGSRYFSASVISVYEAVPTRAPAADYPCLWGSEPWPGWNEGQAKTADAHRRRPVR